ncbi:TetR/AcrR family transcriptional regulator [Microbacterium fluvii]|uniref:TetR/AcrR family transcriptional regulator n=1 Tax=Microbacterium fluvii TaxID=415215 RepID=A0ABW2HB12_9MICO|nr:TetR/AcrR family transcriptional regulator [Microbacterium fluvii]MCU4672102.1 TetR/AcrR family transcriptional regulator [Microbacterium fluvii]
MTVGRPKASSRETLAEAASELFLEQGYAATTVDDITRRAGVSRSSFFNYFSSKADVLWGAFDERLDAAASALRDGAAPAREAVRSIGDGFAPDSLALAVAQASAMGIGDDLERERAVRQVRLAHAVADRLERDGTRPLEAQVRAAAWAGALLAAVWSWSEAGPGRSSLSALVDDALSYAP